MSLTGYANSIVVVFASGNSLVYNLILLVLVYIRWQNPVSFLIHSLVCSLPPTASGVVFAHVGSLEC